MYFAAYAAGSKYLILGSRFIVGLGAGAGASIFAELAQTTTRKQRTTIFSLFMAMRQLGLVIGKYDSSGQLVYEQRLPLDFYCIISTLGPPRL